MSTRQKITPMMSTEDMLLAMSEGNPGGLTVLLRLARGDGGATAMDILHLDDMGIRGGAIHAGFRDHCGSDMAKFVVCLRTRDRAFVDRINKEMEGDHGFVKAVVGGAS